MITANVTSEMGVGPFESILLTARIAVAYSFRAASFNEGECLVDESIAIPTADIASIRTLGCVEEQIFQSANRVDAICQENRQRKKQIASSRPSCKVGSTSLWAPSYLFPPTHSLCGLPWALNLGRIRSGLAVSALLSLSWINRITRLVSSRNIMDS